MNDQIVTNMAEASKAAEQKFKDITNGNVPDNPTSLADVNKTDTTMPEMGHNQGDVVVKNEFKTDAGVIGEDPTLIKPPYEEPTPDTEQEKAPSGVTEQTAAVQFDANVGNADDFTDDVEITFKKAEEELNKAFTDSIEGEPYSPDESSMDGSSDSGSTDETSTDLSSETESSDDSDEDSGSSDEEVPQEVEESEDSEEIDDKEDDSEEETSDDEENIGKECDETEYKNVSVSGDSKAIEEKVDGFITTDGDKVQELIPPVIEVDLKEGDGILPAENPTSDIVQEENAQTSSLGEAPGAQEILEELDKLNIVADSLDNNGTLGSSGADTGDNEYREDCCEEQKQIQNGEDLPEGDGGSIGSESEEENFEEEVKEPETEETSGDAEYTGSTDEVEDTEDSEGGISDDKGAGVQEPQPIRDENTDVSADSNGSDAQVGEAGDTTGPLDTDVDLHGNEFEQAAKEFDNIVKTDDIGDSTVGETFMDKTDLVTGDLDKMAAHAESVREELRRAGAMVGFESAMLGIHRSGMESATNTNDTFDRSGDLLKDIFKGL